MPKITGVVFRKNGNIHYIEIGDIDTISGDKLVCRIEDSVEIGEIVTPVSTISESEAITKTGKAIRKATYYDLSVYELNKSKELEGVKKFEEFSSKYSLPMKLVDVHIIFDKSKMIFYFTSEKRVDFREMVKELASHFKIRIELRQIGVRDEAKIVGGLGPCGMNLCCKSFLTDFESISIKMAKDQNLPLNPLKISGICGRLMCCLKYEYESYREFVDSAPERGTPVKCSHGKGYVYGYEPLKGKVVVEFENESRVSTPIEDIEIDNEREMSKKITERHRISDNRNNAESDEYTS